MRTAYRCRAYPDEAQQQVLARTFGCVRLVWNRTLAERHQRYRAEGKGTSYAESDRALTVMKKTLRSRFCLKSPRCHSSRLSGTSKGVRRILRQARPLPAVQVQAR
jgi:transposase